MKHGIFIKMKFKTVEQFKIPDRRNEYRDIGFLDFVERNPWLVYNLFGNCSERFTAVILIVWREVNPRTILSMNVQTGTSVDGCPRIFLKKNKQNKMQGYTHTHI